MTATRSWFNLLLTLAFAAGLAGCDVGESTTSTSDIAISPSSAYISSATVTVVKFYASGGSSNFTWSASSSTLGTLYPNDDMALYQSTTTAGTNTITVMDSDGNTASAVILQE